MQNNLVDSAMPAWSGSSHPTGGPGSVTGIVPSANCESPDESDEVQEELQESTDASNDVGI